MYYTSPQGDGQNTKRRPRQPLCVARCLDGVDRTCSGLLATIHSRDDCRNNASVSCGMSAATRTFSDVRGYSLLPSASSSSETGASSESGGAAAFFRLFPALPLTITSLDFIRARVK